jgi:hypothetical protein
VNVKGGETRVFDMGGPQRHALHAGEPWSALLLDDARVIHESTPIQPLDPALPAHRDTLVVTLRRDGFQGPQAILPGHDMTSLAIGFADIAAAAARPARRGPPHAGAHLAHRRRTHRRQVFFKCENFQRMGAFKFRGAYNALARFTPEQRKTGVIAFSRATMRRRSRCRRRLLGMPSVIVMPQDAPAPKLAATRGYQQGQAGSEVVLYDRYTEDREPSAGALPPSAA